MKIKRFFLALLLIFGLMTGAPEVRATDADDLVCEMLNYYQHYQEDAWTDIQWRLQQLEAVNPQRAAQWRALMDSWVQINHIDFSQDTLPDGLPQDDSLCIVVMGYQLGAKGSIQPELEGRLKIALEAARKYPNAYILVTGGATSSGSGATEAGRMADWLIQNGIASQRIIQENQAFSTEQNAIYGMKLLKSDYPQVRHLAMVTSDYHMIRSHLVFAARQTEVGGEIIDIVGHACYDTDNSTTVSYANQAAIIALMVGQDIEDMDKPVLTKLTGLSVQCAVHIEQAQVLSLTAIAKYENGFTREVTDHIAVTGFDPQTPGPQTVTVSYTENGETMRNTIGISVSPAETQPQPTEPQSAPTQPEAETPSAEIPELKWLGILAAALAVLLLLLIYELRQKYLRRKRRKNRIRKKMDLE